jgi:capsule biosynthesis phosphatase
MATTKTIVFDLDDTICFPNHAATETHKKYGLAKPNTKVISMMCGLRDSGYYIIIFSARRMVTHSGDIDKIVADVGQVTIDWLAQHHVPYDELKFGKPYSNTWYVDDKALDLTSFYKWADYEINCSRKDR